MVKFSLWDNHDWGQIGAGAIGAIAVSLAVSIATSIVVAGAAV
jgi:hypothetical protein